MYFLAVMGFCIGGGVAITPLSVLNCSVATVFVCIAEDPAAFAASNRDLYELLTSEWSKHHEVALIKAGYIADSPSRHCAEIQEAPETKLA